MENQTDLTPAEPNSAAEGDSCAVDRSCTLDPAQMPERTARWKKLFTNVLSHDRTPSSATFEFSNTDYLRAELDELVKLERICCAHVAWVLEENDTGLELTLKSGAKNATELASDNLQFDTLVKILLPEAYQ